MVPGIFFTIVLIGALVVLSQQSRKKTINTWSAIALLFTLFVIAEMIIVPSFGGITPDQEPIFYSALTGGALYSMPILGFIGWYVARNNPNQKNASKGVLLIILLVMIIVFFMILGSIMVG